MFVAQYHLIEFAEALLRLLRMLEDLNKTRVSKRFWYPRLATLLAHLRQSHAERHVTDGEEGNDNDGERDVWAT